MDSASDKKKGPTDYPHWELKRNDPKNIEKGSNFFPLA